MGASPLGAVLLVDVALWRGKTGRRRGWHLEPVRDPWPRTGRGGTGPALRGVAPWLALVRGRSLAWEVLGIDTGPHQYHLTISALAQAYRPLNAALLLVWMLVGVGYEAARVRAPAATSGGRRGSDAIRRPRRAGARWPQPWDHSEPTTARRRCSAVRARPSVSPSGWPSRSRPSSSTWQLGARTAAGRLQRSSSASSPPHGSANLALIVAWVFAGYHLFAR